MTADVVGLMQYESLGEVARAVHAAIQVVLDGPPPTEEEVRGAMLRLGCTNITLTFSPNVGVEGEIYGGRMAQFYFRATWSGHGISGGTLKPFS